MKEKIIFAVDDEENIRDLYSCALSSSGFNCETFSSGKELFEKLKFVKPDLILLDLMLPEEDGFTILERLKSGDFANLPVIMVSAKGEEISKVKGLNLGANDYIEKPFGVLELIARINANTRNTELIEKEFSFKDIVIDESKHLAKVKDNLLNLTLKEYILLKLLVKKATSVVTREQILIEVWGQEYIGETRTLDIHIATLRKNISLSDCEIVTIRGVGYMLK